MGGKWLELLQETVPRLYTVAVTVNRDLKVHRDMVSELEAIAPTRGVKLQFLDVRNPQALAGAFEQARRTAQAVLVLGDPITVNNRTKVTALASKHQLPTLYSMREFVVDGGLMGYGFDSVTMYRSTADYVDKILKGAKPAELPIEQVSRYLLVVNLGTAKALKLRFPESILLRADEVIE
jgi:putative ABC transport system substrate-binding protein